MESKYKHVKIIYSILFLNNLSKEGKDLEYLKIHYVKDV